MSLGWNWKKLEEECEYDNTKYMYMGIFLVQMIATLEVQLILRNLSWK